MAKPVVFVLGGFGGTELLQINSVFPNRKIWYSKSELSINGPDNLQLGPDGFTPGPLAGNPLAPQGMVDLGYYEPLMTQLANDGWDANFVGYDWRLKLTIGAAKLQLAIQTFAGGGNYWVVAHSMGGLIARLAYARMGGGSAVPAWQRTVYLGTPHGGSYAAAQNLASYVPSQSFSTELASSLGLVVRRITQPFASPAPLTDRFNNVVASFAGLYALLPNIGLTYGPLDPAASQLWDLENYAAWNSHVQQARLNDATQDQASLQNALSAPRPAEVCVVGFGKNTAESLKDIKQMNSAKGYTSSTEGDGSVLETRATLPRTDTLRIQGDHFDIVYGSLILSRITALLKNGLASDETLADPPVQIKPIVTYEPPPTLTTVEFPFVQKRGDP